MFRITERAARPLNELKRLHRMFSKTGDTRYPNKYTINVARFVFWTLVRHGASVTVDISYEYYVDDDLPRSEYWLLTFTLQNGDFLTLQAASEVGSYVDWQMQPDVTDNPYSPLDCSPSGGGHQLDYLDILMRENVTHQVTDDNGDRGNPLEAQP